MIPKSRNIIKKGFKDVVKTLEQYNWQVDNNQFALILSMVYYPLYNVRFLPEPGDYPIEIYNTGIVQTFLDKNLISDKQSIVKNLNDEENNSLFIELGKIFDKVFHWRKFLNKLNKQDGFYFSVSDTIQYQLDYNRDNFIEWAINDLLDSEESNGTEIFDLYDTFLPSLTKEIRKEVETILDKEKPEKPPIPKEESPKIDQFDYILWKKERKRKLKEKSVKTESIKPKKRRLKRKKKV